LNFEIEFTLPIGYRDDKGLLHRVGRMRLATAKDEIEPFENPYFQRNSAFFSIILISRVLVSLGEYSPVSIEVVENLFAADFIFLQDLYFEMNTGQGQLHKKEIIETECPACRNRFFIDVNS
jgi:hypothetical protein